MVFLSLAFLFAALFGAYAYGAATVLSLRSRGPVWSAPRDAGDAGRRLDTPSLALFVLSTAWFVLVALEEFLGLVGRPGDGWLDVLTLMLAFWFPPLIMHTVYRESQYHLGTAGAAWRRILLAAHVVSPAIGLYLGAAVVGLLPLPPSPNASIGLGIALAFTFASVYCTLLMYRRRPSQPSALERRTRLTMATLFAVMTAFMLGLVFLREGQLMVAVLQRLMKAAPLYFLVASVYLENRFEFYDLVVKRGVMMVASLAVVGGMLAIALPWLDGLPAGPVRPWLFAVALLPAALLLPALHATMGRWLDRAWFGREFTPVDAVKHVLAGMQPATDEPSLVLATETRLAEIFGAPVAVLVDAREAPAGAAIEAEVASPSPVSRTPVRIAILRQPGARTILSEDLGLLRSLASVFGFMLENVRLQRKRLEQEQVAQDLRLQTSRSELKALRAQINPHFLFNALNAIASLIHTDPARADLAVEQLAEVFRYTLRRSESEWAPLDQELAFARAYLDVEQARFGARLAYGVDADDAALRLEGGGLLRGIQVPSMLLQTLVENAVKHGISPARGAGRIDIHVRALSDRVVVEVRNTGPGPDAPPGTPRGGEGFGLRSVHDRLRGHFGDLASLTLEREDGTGMTVARITMPRVGVHA
ncbi:MAG: sensor histidine kinase [Vicinamibacterales bacterium]